jgi:hypothetical protein
MDEEIIFTAQDVYFYFTGVYKEALPEMFEVMKEVGTKRIIALGCLTRT